jgi:hypothetical protein
MSCHGDQCTVGNETSVVGYVCLLIEAASVNTFIYGNDTPR